jgi:hypothetical protein
MRACCPRSSACPRRIPPRWRRGTEFSEKNRKNVFSEGWFNEEKNGSVGWWGVGRETW